MLFHPILFWTVEISFSILALDTRLFCLRTQDTDAVLRNYLIRMPSARVWFTVAYSATC